MFKAPEEIDYLLAHKSFASLQGVAVNKVGFIALCYVEYWRMMRVCLRCDIFLDHWLVDRFERRYLDQAYCITVANVWFVFSSACWAFERLKIDINRLHIFLLFYLILFISSRSLHVLFLRQCSSRLLFLYRKNCKRIRILKCWRRWKFFFNFEIQLLISLLRNCSNYSRNIKQAEKMFFVQYSSFKSVPIAMSKNIFHFFC